MIDAIIASGDAWLLSRGADDSITSAANSAPVRLIAPAATDAPSISSLFSLPPGSRSRSRASAVSRSSSKPTIIFGAPPKVPIASGRGPMRSMKCSAALFIIPKSTRASMPVSIITTTG